MKIPWICYSKESESNEYRVFLFPHSGAGASTFASWGRTFLNEGFDFFPVQYPMRESRAKEKLSESFVQLVHDFADSTLELMKEKKFIFYGKCLGSLAAYEAERYVRKKYGIGPELIVTSSGVAPEDMKAERISSDAPEEVWHKNFLRYGFVSAENLQNETFVNFYLPVLKADYILQSEYEPDSEYKVNCPICSLYGKDDPKINEKILEKWNKYTVCGVKFFAVEGSHFFENRDNLTEICGIIRKMV